MIDPKVTPRYITTSKGMAGHFALMVWWNRELGGFWEPWDTGFGRYAEIEGAEQEGRDWALDEGIPFVPAPQEKTS